MTGLLIGAGFSSEFGMPLVWQLTEEIYNWLAPEKIRSLNKGWISQGGGHDLDVIEEFAGKLNEKSLHYEELIGWLRTRSIQEHGKRQQDFYALYTWMMELVGLIFIIRHIRNFHYINASIAYYRGLTSLLEMDNPLWILSLNHDICIEILASELNIPMKTGFPSDNLKLPRRNEQGLIIGDLTVNIMDRKYLILEKMDFFHKGEIGINLLKIHGSLDVFLYLDAKKYVKLMPSAFDTEGWLKVLEQANNELVFTKLDRKVKPANEIAFEDYDGEMQFLRRTLLAGEYKFEQRISHNTPPELLEAFEQALNNVDELIIIGYGFGDKHINQIIERWLNSTRRKIVVVDPQRDSIPECLQKFESCVSIQKKSAIEWLDDISGNTLTENEKIIKRIRNPNTKKDVILKEIIKELVEKSRELSNNV